MKKFNAILLFGSLWGLLEATLGHILHLPFMPLIAGTIMFPIASAILVAAYNKLDSRRSLLYITLIAVAIKGVDFAFVNTVVSPFKIINPMVGMLLEGLVVLAVVHIIVETNLVRSISSIFTINFGWRILFVAYMYANAEIMGSMVPKYLASASLLFTFITVEGLIGGIIGTFMLTPLKNYRLKFDVYNPILASVTLTLAIVATYLL